MSKPFFSVIVPAYNSAEYIRNGLHSIRQQSFRDFELIVVCDRCTDNTANIVLGYTDKLLIRDYGYDGLSRNAGLDAAEGEWILFMDDDDWWTDDSAFQVIAEGIRHGGDFDVLAYGFVFGSNGPTRQWPGHLYIAIWNKAWRRGFIGDTRFPDVPHSDDVGFAEQTHYRARFRFLDEILYYYDYMRPGSITQKLHTGELKTLEQMGLR